MKGIAKHSSTAISGKMRFTKPSSKNIAFGLAIFGYSLILRSDDKTYVTLVHSQ